MPVDAADVEQRLPREPDVVRAGRISWIQLSVAATRLAWLRIAPFGRPVVPDV